jgi:Flp pilus assembly protein TadD
MSSRLPAIFSLSILTVLTALPVMAVAAVPSEAASGPAVVSAPSPAIVRPLVLAPATPPPVWRRAEADLRRQLSQQPRDRRLHARLLGLLYDNRDWMPLLEAYRQAVRQFPQDVPFWQGLAEIAAVLDRPQEALDARMKVLSLDPTKALVWSGQSIGLLRSGRRPAGAASP